MEVFGEKDLKKLYMPLSSFSGEDNGQVTIIGGSKLFHGAPILSLKVASRIVDMVFFATPEPSIGRVAEQIKSKLPSFIWVPWEEVGKYIEKSDAVLIGPGLMRYSRETQYAKRKTKTESRISYHVSRTEYYDEAGKFTGEVTKELLLKFPHKKWVIDAGSLQTMDPKWIPQNAILTPNKKEYKILFGDLDPRQAAQKYKCTIVLKGPTTYIYSAVKLKEIHGGNAGLTKGGTGDVQAGLTVSLLAKNDPFLAACSASYIVKATAGELYKKVGVNYNADDLTDKIPEVLKLLTS